MLNLQGSRTVSLHPKFHNVNDNLFSSDSDQSFRGRLSRFEKKKEIQFMSFSFTLRCLQTPV